MKRRVVVMLLLLVGGAIVNVMVAIACIRFGLYRTTPAEVDRTWWSSNPAPEFAGTPVFHEQLAKIGASVDILHNGESEADWMHGVRIRSGLPCFAFVGTSWTFGARRNQLTSGLIPMGANALPFEPIWPGFAFNTVFDAFILWLLFAAPFALRRRRRFKRGLCPKCAYDLRGGRGSDSKTCPECGTSC